MTTIITDGEFIVADTQMQQNGVRIGPFRKIRELTNERRAIGAGSMQAIMAFEKWCDNGCDVEQWPSFSLDSDSEFAIIGGGEILGYHAKLPPNAPLPLQFPQAWGSGQELAFGALDSGLNAKQAMQVALRRDVHSGWPIHVVDLRTGKLREYKESF